MTARPPIPPPPYTGGCLCGAVRYTLKARPLAINACHCQDCKRLTGATYNLALTVLRKDLEHSGQLEAYHKTADSGRKAHVRRCAVCGTRMWHEPNALPEQIFLLTGTLDDSSWAIPTGHIWVEKASPDTVFRDDAIRIEGQPKDRQPLLDAFTKIYGKQL